MCPKPLTASVLLWCWYYDREVLDFVESWILKRLRCTEGQMFEEQTVPLGM